MKWTPIVLMAVMVTVGFLPGGSANPSVTCDGSVRAYGIIEFDAYGDCSGRLQIDADEPCPSGTKQELVPSAGGGDIRIRYCVPFTELEPPGECPTRKASLNGATGRHRISINSDCTVQAWLNDGIPCVEGTPRTRNYTVGPVAVVEYACPVPGGDPDTPYCWPRAGSSKTISYGLTRQCEAFLGAVDSEQLCPEGTQPHHLRGDVPRFAFDIGYCTPDSAA